MNEVGTTDMVSQPSHKQDSEADFASMTISSPQTQALRIVEPIIAFQHGKEAFNLTTLAPVLAILGDLLQGDQGFLACLKRIVDDFRHDLQHLDNEGDNSLGVIGLKRKLILPRCS
jgi:hypothetical protein